MLSKMLFLILIWILLIYINLLAKLKHSQIHATFSIPLSFMIAFSFEFTSCFFFCSPNPMVAFVFIRIPHMVRAFLSQHRDWVDS